MPTTFDALYPLARDLPPIVMLSSADLPGAGGATLNMHTGLAAAGADVTTLVMLKTQRRAGVSKIAQGSNLDRAYRVMNITAMRRYPSRPRYFEMFSTAQSPVRLDRIDAVRNARLVHLHWVAGMVGFPQAADALHGKHVVWTLHDMNPLTGGCHCTSGCDRYTGGCALCPQLGEATGGGDVAARNFAWKQAGYAGMDITVVSPGTCLLDCAGKSGLLGQAPRTRIPHCVDPHIFAPRSRAWARAAFGLPPDRKIVAFGAAGINRWNKGLQFLKLALELLRSRWPGEAPLPLIVIFGGDAQGMLPGGYACRTLGHLSQAELADMYACADVFVSASLQEAFGLVSAEAQACGTPVIGFYGTGAEDIVKDGVTGYLAAHPGYPLTAEGRLRSEEEFLNPENVGDLAEKIHRILEMPAKESATMRERCREHALRAFSPVLQAARYLRLYRRILGLPEVRIGGLPE